MPNFDDIESVHIADPSLALLKDQIKNTMIPLLIRTFQMSNQMQETQIHSRLSTSEEVDCNHLISQLDLLDEDLKSLGIWSQNCRIQIEKARHHIHPNMPLLLEKVAKATPHLAAQKSFQNTFIKKRKISWWRKRLKKLYELFS